MSSARGSLGSPCTVTSKYDPFSFATHWAVSNPGTLTNGVSIVFPFDHTGASAADPVMLRPLAERYACNSPLPPTSAAGFAHAAIIPSLCTRPKRVLSGGGIVERNDAYAITQPVCDAERQTGTFLNAPPTSLPFGTARLVPRSSADTRRD